MCIYIERAVDEREKRERERERKRERDVEKESCRRTNRVGGMWVGGILAEGRETQGSQRWMCVTGHVCDMCVANVLLTCDMCAWRHRAHSDGWCLRGRICCG